MNCLSVFDHFVGLALKVLRVHSFHHFAMVYEKSQFRKEICYRKFNQIQAFVSLLVIFLLEFLPVFISSISNFSNCKKFLLDVSCKDGRIKGH